ncbi:MAG: SRPBCC domain-containing protein [Lapillicoccus sp.]
MVHAATETSHVGTRHPGIPQHPAPHPGVLRRIHDQPVGGTLASADRHWRLTMVRDLPHRVERVWAMLTDPEQLARWSPVVPNRALTSTGPAHSGENPSELSFDAEVLVADAPRELVHRWGAHLLRWTLDPTPQGCRLTLQQELDRPGDPDAPRGPVGPARPAVFGAGWHVCLAVLTEILDERGACAGAGAVERVVGRRSMDYGWRSLHDDYAQLLG